MSATPTPRRLERRDLPDLIRLCREHAAYERSTWTEYDRLERLQALLIDSAEAGCWVVDGEGELAGFATVALQLSTWDAGRYLYLDCLYLRPAYRGRGLGRALMREVARRAVELGALEVQWQTPSWNADAVRFYDRLGAGRAEKLRFTLRPEECAELAGTSRE